MLSRKVVSKHRGHARGHGISGASGPGDVFNSYSRTDLPAAARLYEELKSIGGEAIRFGKCNLRPGVENEHSLAFFSAALS
jgi:hypothetical protein